MSYRVKFRPVGTKLPFTATLHENSVTNPPVLTKTVTTSNNIEYFESESLGYTISPYNTYCVKVVDSINSEVEVCDVDYPNYVLTIIPDGSVTYDYEIMGTGTNGTTQTNIDVPFNEVVRLEAFPNSGYDFLKWTTPDGDVTNNPYIFNMPNNNINVSCFAEEVGTNSIQFVIDTSLGPTPISFGLPLTLSGTYNFVVDWGDGNSQTVTSSAIVEHSYVSNGIYNVTLTGTISELGTSISEHRGKYTEFHVLGDVGLININKLFLGCSNLTTVTTYNGNWCQNVNGMYGLFNGCTSLTNLDVSNWNVGNVADMGYMFSGCTSLLALNVTNWNVSKVADMNGMFYGCISLSTLDVSNWNVGGVVNMSDMFSGCISLPTLNVTNWNVSSVINMENMFSSCELLNNLDVSLWNVTNVNHMFGMFQYCKHLTSLNVTNWDVSNVSSMSYMFYECSLLTSLDVSRWITFSVTAMNDMFNSCTSLSTLDVSNWDIVSLTDINGMFYNCIFLTSLDVSNWNISNITSMNTTFFGVTLDTTSYDNLLVGWSTLSFGETRIPTNLTLDAGNSKFTSLGEAAKTILEGTYNWTISDGGLQV